MRQPHKLTLYFTGSVNNKDWCDWHQLLVWVVWIKIVFLLMKGQHGVCSVRIVLLLAASSGSVSNCSKKRQFLSGRVQQCDKCLEREKNCCRTAIFFTLTTKNYFSSTADMHSFVWFRKVNVCLHVERLTVMIHMTSRTFEFCRTIWL